MIPSILVKEIFQRRITRNVSLCSVTLITLISVLSVYAIQLPKGRKLVLGGKFFLLLNKTQIYIQYRNIYIHEISVMLKFHEEKCYEKYTELYLLRMGGDK